MIYQKKEAGDTHRKEPRGKFNLNNFGHLFTTKYFPSLAGVSDRLNAAASSRSAVWTPAQ